MVDHNRLIAIIAIILLIIIKSIKITDWCGLDESSSDQQIQSIQKMNKLGNFNI